MNRACSRTLQITSVTALELRIDAVGLQHCKTPLYFDWTCRNLLLLACSALAIAEDGSVRCDGFLLHYTTSSSGKPLVFLAGGPGGEVDYLKSEAQFFPSSFQFVFLEQRGTGRSVLSKMTAENMTLRLGVEDLEALRESMKQERLFLVGQELWKTEGAATVLIKDINPGLPSSFIQYMALAGNNNASAVHAIPLLQARKREPRQWCLRDLVLGVDPSGSRVKWLVPSQNVVLH